jgi:hypothetical protein
MHLRERPLLAMHQLRSPDAAMDQMLSALADRCFGASYSGRLGLA